MKNIKTVETVLNKFPEVEWDRFSGDEDDFAIFGWIKRSDGKRDIMVIIFIDYKANGFLTSSAKYSKEFHKRLGLSESGHSNCKLVADYFPKLKNKIERVGEIIGLIK